MTKRYQLSMAVASFGLAAIMTINSSFAHADIMPQQALILKDNGVQMNTPVKSSVSENSRLNSFREVNNNVQLKTKTISRISAKTNSKGDNLYGYLYEPCGPQELVGLYEFMPTGLENRWQQLTGAPISSSWLENGKIKGFSVGSLFGLIMAYDYVEYDMVGGECTAVESADMSALQSVFQVAGYDFHTMTIYGYGQVGDAQGFMKASALKPLTAELIKGNVGDEYCISVAYNPVDHYMYGITTNHNFVKIDPSTGNQETLITIEDSDIENIASGMVYDGRSGVFYWNKVQPNYRASMIAIDPKEKTYDIVETLVNGEHFSSLYTLDKLYGDLMPKDPFIKSVDFTDGNTNGKVVYTLPSKLMNGTDISGNISWTSYLDGNEYSNGSAVAGSDVTVDYDVVENGIHMFAVEVSYNGETGNRVSEIRYIGNDTPKTPANVTLTTNKVSWYSVKESVHGGYLDVDNIEYEVRLNGEVVKTTKATEADIEIPTDCTVSAWRVSVVAKCHGMESEPAVSNKIVAGNPYKVPVEFAPTKAEFEVMTTYKGNSNEVEADWVFNTDNVDGEYIGSGYIKEYGARSDAWLFLPPIEFENVDETYTFSFENKCWSSFYTDEFMEVKLCSQPDANKSVANIIEEFQPGQDWGVTTGKFKVETPGVYYIALHCTSKPLQMGIKTRKYQVSTISMGYPEEPTEITAVPGENGALNATVSLKLPTHMLSGELYPENTPLKAVVTGENEVVVEGHSGETVSAMVNTKQGNNVISVKAQDSEGGQSIAKTVTVYTGVVIPSAVENLRYEESADMKSLHLKWDAPTKGDEEGYVNPETVTYSIYILSNNQWALYQDNLTETEYEFKLDESMGVEQAYAHLGVLSKNVAGSNGTVMVASGWVGAPYELPIEEKFEDLNSPFTTEPWIALAVNDSYTAQWGVGKGKDLIENFAYDGAGLVSVPDKKGSCGIIGTPRFSTTGHDNVKVTMSIYDLPNFPTVKLYANYYGIDLQEVGELVGSASNTLKQFEISLPTEFTNKFWVGLFIDVKFANDGQILYIDNLSINDGSGVELEDILAPNRAITGGEGKISIMGYKDEYFSVYTIDGKVVANSKAYTDTAVIGVRKGIYVVKAGNDICKIIVR